MLPALATDHPPPASIVRRSNGVRSFLFLRPFQQRRNLAAPPGADGAVHKWHQRLKGIQPRFSNDELRTLDSLERFSITDHNGWMEWHEEEIHPTFGKFRWTGLLSADQQLICLFG
jgi:hypothetical protein